MSAELYSNSLATGDARLAIFHESYPFRRQRLEASLVLITAVRALFDFNHFCGLQHLEPMSSCRQQDHITGGDSATLQVVATISVEIDPNLTGLDEQHFLCPNHVPFYGIVNMRRNHIPPRTIHVCHLLGKHVGSEELNPFRRMTAADDDSDCLVKIADRFYRHWTSHSYEFKTSVAIQLHGI